MARAGARRLHWLRRETGIVFQDPYASLDPRMSIGRIVGEPLWALDLPGDRRARVREVLTQVGLTPDMAARYPHEFSGGQRQRIAIARAIVHRPRLLVGDEPLSALDADLRRRLAEDIRTVLRAAGTTGVVVTHDLAEAAVMADRTVRLGAGGRIAAEEDGPAVASQA